MLKFTRKYWLLFLSMMLCSAFAPHHRSDDKYGDLALALRLSKDVFSISNKAFSDLLRELTDLNNVFLSENLCNLNRVNESRALLSNCFATVNNCDKTYKSAMDTLEARVKAASFQENDFRIGFLKGFNESRLESQKLFEEYFNIKRAVISKCDEVLEFLTSIYGEYYESQGYLVFQDANHLEQYTILIDDLESLEAQEKILFKTLKNSRHTKL